MSRRLTALALVAGFASLAGCALPPDYGYGSNYGYGYGSNYADVVAMRAPPPLPYYDQPMAPGPGYIWTPGYWAWGSAGDYDWMPGSWVMPPEAGLLWTPGWWGASGNAYRWHPGYWGREVGFYGGIDYGHGYPGTGYQGGQWRDHQFFYNSAFNNIDRNRFHNVYVDRPSRPHRPDRNVSYNGGSGGIPLRPTLEQQRMLDSLRTMGAAQRAGQADWAPPDDARRIHVDPRQPRIVTLPPREAQRAPRAGEWLRRPQMTNQEWSPPEARREVPRMQTLPSAQRDDRRAPAANPGRSRGFEMNTRPARDARRPAPAAVQLEGLKELQRAVQDRQRDLP